MYSLVSMSTTDSGIVTIGVRMPADMHEKLQQELERRRKTQPELKMAALIRAILRKALP